MSIVLQENATPTARLVPKHYEPESKKTVTELIDKGVITPVNEATTWCSLAFFVPKADGKRILLVTDFTAQNKFVRRPTHPFPSTREIIEAIPPEAKLFCKLDAVHGYFQLALDDKSSRLTGVQETRERKGITFHPRLGSTIWPICSRHGLSHQPHKTITGKGNSVGLASRAQPGL